MHKNKIFTLIQSFTQKELKEIKLFLASPYYNTQPLYSNYLDLLVKSKSKAPSKEEIYSRMFPGETFSDIKLRLINSQLLQLVEQYLVIKKMESDELYQVIALSQTYRSRELKKHYLHHRAASYRILQDQTVQNADYFAGKYAIEMENYHFESGLQRSKVLNLQQISDTIDTAFLTFKLRQTCLMMAHQSVFKTEYQFGLLDALLPEITMKNRLDTPAISVYYYCFKSLIDPNDKTYFEKFKSEVLAHYHLFPPEEARDLFLLATNYCIKKTNEGRDEFAVDALDLYEKALDKELLVQNGVLSRFSYANIVNMGLKSGKLDFVAQFIQQYKAYLEIKHLTSAYSFNMARLEYARKNYEAVIELLRNAEYKDLITNLTAKTILLKVFFEMGAFNLLESHLDAMNTFIRRKRKVISYHELNCLNIIKYTKKILSLNPFDKAEKNLLREQIEKEEMLTERKWLVERLGVSGKN